MKNILLLIISSAFFFFSCGEKKESIIKESSDKKLKISVIGKKMMALDPWNLDITVEGYGKKGTLSTEYHGDINEEQITFNWLEGSACEIKLKEQDGITRTVLIKADERGIQAQELKRP